MRVSDKIKKIIAIDFAIGVILTVVLWNTLGMEGMAAKFCDSIHVDRCDEIEWSEEYDRTGEAGTGRSEGEFGASADEDSQARVRVGLRSGS